jgi:WD40 repeat protein
VQLGEWGISIWDWRSRESLMTIDAEGQRLAFTQDGLLINADRRGPVLVSDPGSGAVVARLTGHTGGTWSLDLSPDGTRLATVGRDGTVRLWDTRTWTEQLALPGHAGSGLSVRFSPDGRRLATLGDDGLARVWAMDLEDLLRIAQTKVTRTLSLEECRQYLHVEDCSQAVIRS